jgi:hypothetical protein
LFVCVESQPVTRQRPKSVYQIDHELAATAFCTPDRLEKLRVVRPGSPTRKGASRLLRCRHSDYVW